MVNVVSCYRRAEAQQIHFTSYRPFSSLSKCTFIHFWSFLLLPTPLHFLYISRASLVHPKALNRTFTTRVKTWLCAETCVYTRTQEVLNCQHCSATRKKFLSSLGTRFDHRNSNSSGSVLSYGMSDFVVWFCSIRSLNLLLSLQQAHLDLIRT